MYDVRSMKAEDFIDDGEIRETLDYADQNKDNVELIDSIIDKAKLRKGLTHREASVLLACEMPDKINEIYDLAEQIKTLAAECPELAESCRAWLGSREDTALSAQAGEALLAACETLSHPLVKEIADSADLLAAKSVWLIGGDGWAFDIGFGGLDHVLASGEKVRVLVLNTQVYSNTGGQASKATPAGAAARLMSGGKSGAEKDLGLMAMTYGHVYVAQVAMGANPNQLLKAMREAEAWDGAALIIAYAPCIAHGIDMRDVQEIEKKAVQCGYFPLYRYHPANGLMLDSKAPDGDFQAFLMRQGRFAALRRSDPEKSESLCQMAEEAARRRWNLLEMLKNRKMP